MILATSMLAQSELLRAMIGKRFLEQLEPSINVGEPLVVTSREAHSAAIHMGTTHIAKLKSRKESTTSKWDAIDGSCDEASISVL
jgi:hypothetical protein